MAASAASRAWWERERSVCSSGWAIRLRVTPNVGGEKVGGGGLGRNLDGRIAELRIGPAPAP